MIKRVTKFLVIAAFTFGVGFAITSLPSNASARTIPTGMRHNWYQNFTHTKLSDSSFIKLRATSIDSGTKQFHSKVTKSNLQVIKKTGGWYQIGAKGIANPAYKLKKLKIAGKYRVVLLKRYSTKSHYADVFVRSNVKLPLSQSDYFLG